MRLSQSLALLIALALPAFAQDGGEPGAPPALPGETVGAAASLPASLTSALRGSPLELALAPVSEDPIFSDAAVSVQVVNVRTGEEVYAWGDDKPLVPASTMKLLTTAAALRTLGPNYRFPTWIMQGGELGADGVLAGDLFIKGQGDPTMVVERMWRLAQDLKVRGLKEVKGDIVFDDGYFAGTTLIPGWDKEEDLESGPTYFATLGALSVNFNVATIVVRPGAGSGHAAIAEFDFPTPALVLENKIVTGSKSSRKWVKIERALDEETQKVTTFTLTGSVPDGSEADLYYRTLADPLGNYMGAMQAVFKQQGIKVKGQFRAGVAAKDATLFHRVESVSLAEIVATTSKHSNNFMAEQMLRSMGAERFGLPGTTENGLRVVADYLGSLGVPADQFRLVNGSGLSRDVMLRPSAINAVLLDMYRSPDLGPEYVTSLSVGGRDGTLWSRYREVGMAGRVRGKTGTLSGVHCLSGYVHAADDEVYAFTFLVNEIDGALSRARKAHDRLVLTVAGTTGNVADGTEAEAPRP
ncbi:MAG: D-alanyl-D-alanine carboxypeptidase/D-alanyl-D-alanine-endopeptidase [Pseudomonadota bacterium]|nr:D-alanyl-D-alanine carboxypeptidase/D-alanyl-D-alanine-endopeptidase [Pseudomonadota bacterium]